MSHLDETLLNEYLDDAMPAAARRDVEAHLQGCADCRSRLEDLRFVFSSLASLPEESPARELLSSILVRLPRRRAAGIWRLALTAQTVAVLAALLWLALTFGENFGLPALGEIVKFATPPLPTLDLDRIFSIALPALRFPLPTPNSLLPAFNPLASFQEGFPTFQPSTLNLFLLTAAVFLLWVIGNAVLLRGRTEVRQ